MIDYKLFVENSRKWLEDYISSNRLQSLVLGISGGLDSIVSAALAYPVCKKLNIPLIGRTLTTITNKEQERTTAIAVGNAFCNDFKVIDIIYDTELIAKHFEISDGEMSKLQKGNIKARYRMMYLYHVASLNKGVVIDNDNFTEYNLGFFTIHGDQGDINLGLHYLWKTEVYELAYYLCSTYMESTMPIKHTEQSEAIKKSIALIPTDGNGVSNSDCEQFGLENYEQVDDVLKTMYYSNLVPDNKFKDKYNLYKKQGITLINPEFEEHFKEYIRLVDSYNEQGVDKVIELYQNTAYKRQDLPAKPILSKLDFAKIGKVLTTLRKECLAYLRNIVSKHNNSYEFDNDYMVTISYDGGNHPEYASNVYSQVHRIYIKDDKLLFDIDDECAYSEDRITTYELFNIASYIYYSL